MVLIWVCNMYTGWVLIHHWLSNFYTNHLSSSPDLPSELGSYVPTGEWNVMEVIGYVSFCLYIAYPFRPLPFFWWKEKWHFECVLLWDPLDKSVFLTKYRMVWQNKMQFTLTVAFHLPQTRNRYTNQWCLLFFLFIHCVMCRHLLFFIVHWVAFWDVILNFVL